MQSNILIRWGGYGLVLWLLVLGCVARKPSAVPEGAGTRVPAAMRRTVINSVEAQRPQYTTFSGRARSNLAINGEKQYNVTANVRIVHGDSIWISVTALMGIEAARVLITPDSVNVINRLNSVYIRQPFSYLHRFTGGRLDFAALEQLLVGDVATPVAERGAGVSQVPAGYLLQRQTDGLHYTVQVDTNYRNLYTLIADSAHGQQLEAHYSGYRQAGGNTFPYQMEMTMTTPESELRAEVDYNRVVYDGKVSLPFRIPPRYTEIQ